MKNRNRLNVIQIKGIRGLLLAGFVVSCLIAGFVAFPGLVMMKLWNIMATYMQIVPLIGFVQGLLLWGIVAASYFILRKEKVVVCMKASDGLSEEELKSVFAEVKKQTQEDPILQAMMKARETELKLKTANQESETQDNSTKPDTTKV